MDKFVSWVGPKNSIRIAGSKFVLQGLAADRVQSSTAKQLFVGKSPQVQSEFLTSTQGEKSSDLGEL
ncbi:BEL1-like homeodomain protein 9 [Pyrus ussuriensis x Pyrus communis]|uniref:BEL1-like homeodomain protein 9 n=1 Tax=Pyrus ussuriensis x Pyrus communis TaxID=2448454 RepID=A0A5N5GHZ7_9ROSA|nr:BEL1-like homeodomain protein 9 [Pyrus ussuriensis x Pyrus communis]